MGNRALKLKAQKAARQRREACQRASLVEASRPRPTKAEAAYEAAKAVASLNPREVSFVKKERTGVRQYGVNREGLPRLSLIAHSAVEAQHNVLVEPAEKKELRISRSRPFAKGPDNKVLKAAPKSVSIGIANIWLAKNRVEEVDHNDHVLARQIYLADRAPRVWFTASKYGNSLIAPEMGRMGDR